MPIYEFECPVCSSSYSFRWPISQYDTMPIPKCGEGCDIKMEQKYNPLMFKFAYTSGRETGVYELDYGKKATYDLTPPGKIQRLQRCGTLFPDPFRGGGRKGGSFNDLIGAGGGTKGS